MKKWTGEQLRDAVAQSRNVSQTLRLLGLRPVGGNYETIRLHIKLLGLDTSHWGRTKRWIAERHVVESAVQQSESIAEVLRQLDWPDTTTTRRRLRALLALYGLDSSHFRGRAWNRGKRFPERVRPASDYLMVNGPRISSHELRLKLLTEGIFDPRCTTCGNATWQGCPIPLELEHKNGNRNDNRLENVTLLCPNCHALTPTYRGRNIGGYSEESA